MPQIVKTQDQPLTEEIVLFLMGRYVHAPVNNHEIPNDLEGGAHQVENVWFAGKVVGYEKAFIGYDYDRRVELEEPLTFFNLMLSDGMGYQLSTEALELNELTEEEFRDMVTMDIARRVAETAPSDLLTVVQDDKKLWVPGR